MTLVPLEIPPGFYRNGTDVQASGRWRDGSLVRWVDGALAPVGGWESFGTISNTDLRGLFAWEDNSRGRWVVFGGGDDLHVLKPNGTSYDITPTGLTGCFSYIATPDPADDYFFDFTAWSFDNWGEYLLGCSMEDGKIYEWQLNTGTIAAAVTNAPTNCRGLVVTQERFVFALGAGNNPKRVEWCDREDNTTWTAAATNEAGGQDLQTTGKIMQGIKYQDEVLILTDTDAHTATYQGPPYVYGFRKVGNACGAISQRGAASVDEGVFWMGQNGFFQYSGGQVQRLQCDVEDYVFDDIIKHYGRLVHAVSNTKHGEIWWFYPADDFPCDSYVCYNYRHGYWTFGEMDRAAGVDVGVFEFPIYATGVGALYKHETGNAYGGATIYAETGPITLGAGDQVMCATELIPDELTQGDVTATFKTRFHPNDTERSYGPYTMANPTSVRFTGRQVRMRITGSELDDWRVGVNRLDVTPGGRR